MNGHLVQQGPTVEYVQIVIFWSGFQQIANIFENG